MIKNLGFKAPFPFFEIQTKMRTANNINWRVAKRQAKKDFDHYNKKPGA